MSVPETMERADVRGEGEDRGPGPPSYLAGDGGEAVVIDPRRDCGIYIDLARRAGCRIRHIVETHRNEDLISGAPVLAALTGAEVHHGPSADGHVAYARTVREGAQFDIGKLRLQVLETPGHTYDSLSLALYDTESGADAVAVFTGDALFIGDVGRTDFYPERAAEVAGLLYDSLQRIVALGDQAIVYPAHGAGSVCGDAMADREFSTLGYERRNNPMLRLQDRDTFIARKLAEHHDQPPYFRLMEHLNLVGGAPMARHVLPPALSIAEMAQASQPLRVDVRGVAAYLGAHLPGSICLPEDMLSAFAGWLIDPDREIVLVATGPGQAETASCHLGRIGYDRVSGYLSAAVTGWAAAGQPFDALPAIGVAEVSRRQAEAAADWTLLDVRGATEVSEGIVAGARHIYVGALPDSLGSLDRERRYTVMCASGARATIAASLLRHAGFAHVDVFLGSMAAWQAAGQPVERPAASGPEPD